MAQQEEVGTDPLQEQHEEYIQMVDESGLPFWVTDYYWLYLAPRLGEEID